MDKEKIVCAAIWYQDLPSQRYLPINIEKGVVVCGYRHVHCIDIMSNLSALRSVSNAVDGVGSMVQGFLTTSNRFVDRKEAAILALESGQIEHYKQVLYSENLY